MKLKSPQRAQKALLVELRETHREGKIELPRMSFFRAPNVLLLLQSTELRLFQSQVKHKM